MNSSGRCRDVTPGGLPHSDIRGSAPACGSPRLIATCYVLHRLLAPRHSPIALSSLITKFLHRQFRSRGTNNRTQRTVICPDIFSMCSFQRTARWPAPGQGLAPPPGGRSGKSASPAQSSNRRLETSIVSGLPARPARKVVGVTGLEPVTLRLSSACSNQLSYTPRRKADG
jgi:hypothetical protein